MRAYIHSLFVVMLLASASALAQVSLPESGAPVKPRVFVIFDSSTSMQEDPAFQSNFGFYPSDDTQVDPDTDPLGNCRSKFCIAKNVVYDVLRSHTDEVRIGLASYYQYLARYTPVDTRQTKCWYDAMFKPGFTLYYPRTGTTPTQFGGVTAVGDVATGVQLGGGVANSHHRRCPANSNHAYNLTVDMVNPTSVQTCRIYSPNADPGTFTMSTNLGASCVSGSTYTTTGFAADPATCPLGGTCYVRNYAAGTTCAPAVDPATVSMTSPTLVVSGTSAAANGDNWTNFTTIGAECTGAYPCNMYSAGPGATLTSRQSWYGLFDGTCGGGPNAGDGMPFNCINPSSTWPSAAQPFKHASRVDSAVNTFTSTITNQTACLGTLNVRQRYSDGGNRKRFMTAGDYAAATGGLPLPGGYSNNTPTNNCTPNWPCDVTLTNDVLVPQAPDRRNVGNCPSPVPPGGSCSLNGTFGTYRLLRTSASCPALAGPYSSASGLGTWQRSPTCGLGDNQCNFQASATPTVGGTAACAPSVTRWDGNSQPACSDLGLTFPYTAGATNTYSVAKDISASSSCPANGSDAKSGTVYGTSGDWTGQTSQLGTCRGSTNPGACTLTNLNETASPNLETSNPVSSTTPPPGFSGPFASESNMGTTKIDLDPPCTGYTNGTTYDLGTNGLGRFEAGSGPGGATLIGMSGETPIYKCRFQKRQRVWTRPKKRCNYTIQSQVFTTDNSITWCQYDRLRYQLETPRPDLHNCTYSNTIRRFDFQFPTNQQCLFYRMQTTGTRQLYSYVYRYQTKGGEFAGAASRVTTGDVTDPATPYASFQADCPLTWDDCLGAGTMCYLRSSPRTGSTFLGWTKSVNRGDEGRFDTNGSIGDYDFTNTSYFPLRSGVNSGRNPASNAGISCVASDYGTPPAAEPARNRYTWLNGSPPGPIQYKLVSSYLDCTDPDDPLTCATNDIAQINGDPRPAPNTLNPTTMPGGPYLPLTSADWTNAARKAYGYSGVGATYDSPAQMFLGFPADNDSTGNLGQLKQLMSKCEKPSTSNVSGMTWSGRGICMPDIGGPNPDDKSDFTPLYGSLQNVRKYIEASLPGDTTFTGNTTCRPYYVILATDGAENTPSHYADEHLGSLSPTRLQDAVTALRHINSGGRQVDAKTYVIGFGDATADPAAAALLNAMASSGGTTGAYFASAKASLVTELNRVFSSILQGTYSRSKPVISTDGRSIYASQFDRMSGTNEWPGRFYAYGISAVDGSLYQRWELSEQLNNNMTDADRNLFTDIPSVSLKTNFVEGNAALNNRLDDHPQYPDDGPGGSPDLEQDRLIRFMRNKSNAEPYFQTTNPPKRQSRLNAIIHAAPVVVGKSVLPPSWGGPAGSTSLASYASYQAAVAGREERVLVGASDGFLRGIRENTSVAARDGTEAWGWVPSPIHKYLFKQMLGYYNGMDGHIAVADVCADDDADGNARNCALANWKTLAIAATGRGGRGMMALDVTQPDDPKKMWSFVPGSDFGYAVSAPIIGRVQTSPTKDIYLAVFGGGLREQGVDGPLGDGHGDEVYMLNALTGNTVRLFDAEGDMVDDDIFGEDNQFAARPSFWARTGSPYMDHAVYGTVNGRIYISRFRKKVKIEGGEIKVDARTNPDDWRPRVFFDPTKSETSRTPGNKEVRVRRVKEDLSDPSAPVYTQVTSDPLAVHQNGSPDPWAGEKLPLSRRLPIYVRPRSAAVHDPSRLVPDYFVGTGDGVQPGNPRSEFKWNYFYAIHDDNRHDDGHDDGAPLWVNQFINEREQVVGEPAMVSGALIVATYLPPESTSPCENAGDAFFYCFNPLSGDLVKCLVSPDGTATSVLKYEGVGIPSDLVTVGENLYWTASNVNGPPRKETVRPTIETGDIRSWRRVR
ncbi:MAG: hypothetical protein AB1730_14085 [Myxococcota bacterium]